MSVRPTAAWTHSHTWTLPAPAARVFSALTDRDQLRRWFAEHVEIEPRVGGSFRFWGRHTYGAPDRPLAAHTIAALERDRLLAFDWALDGATGDVTLALEPDEKSNGHHTTLTVRHAFAQPLATPYGQELVDDLWRLTFGNLDAHLRGGEGIVLPDYTNPSPEIRLSIVIDAPRERVFRALMDPQALDRWIATAAEVEPRVGGKYSYAWKYEHNGRKVESGPTTILDLVANERLVIDWTDWRGDATRAPTRVAWLLEDAGTGTRVTLVHSGFSRVTDQSDYPFGWRDFLERLAAESRAQRSIFT